MNKIKKKKIKEKILKNLVEIAQREEVACVFYNI